MFTGIVEGQSRCLSVEGAGTGLRLWLAPPELGPGAEPWRPALGESIAVCGACLSVAGLGRAGSCVPLPPDAPGEAGRDVLLELTAETLERTWFRSLAAGSMLNVERALRLGDRLDGHLVAGHVDGRGRVSAVRDAGDGGRELEFELDQGLERYLIEKGSITLDGVSLTVVAPRERRFGVALIPITLAWTNLGAKRVGDPVNVEVDLVGKWIERLVPPAR